MTTIAILGAGMVGTTTALALQARGHDCVLIDRKPPGRETSYGNAGILQAEAMLPYALPDRPFDLLRMALGHRNAVRLNWGGLGGQLPGLLRYFRASLPANMARIGPLWRDLIAEAMAGHDQLAQDAGAEGLIRATGYWEVFASPASFAEGVARAQAMRNEFGVASEALDSAGLARAEPVVTGNTAGAILWAGPRSCSDPGGLVAAYARLFQDRGGRLVQADADDLSPDSSGWRVAGERAERVVLSLGPWTPGALARFGYRVPMVRKQGYHRHFRSAGMPSRPVMLSDQSAVLAPMRAGLRIATAVELPGRPMPDHRQLRRAEAAARRLLDLGAPIEETPWTGTRPCLPGMLPLVMQAPRHRGLWLNFGHGHQGFTLGPATADRLARAMEGDAAAVAGLDRGLR